MLVHMAPKEVAGLQALAMAHGGSLTRNPDTGLPEAGFLKNLLPTLIGAGLMYATGGTAAPLIAGMSNAATIGLGVGGLQALRTGSLSKGLMAGLGAYGGAGMMGSVMGAGNTALGAANATSPTMGPPVEAVASVPSVPATSAVGTAEMYAPTLSSAELSAIPSPSLRVPGVEPILPYSHLQSAAPATSAFGTADMYAPTLSEAQVAAMAPPPVAAPTVAPPAAPDLGQYANPRDRFLQQGTVESPAYAREFSSFEKAKAGLGELAKTPKDFLTKDNLKYGLAAAAPMLFQQPNNTPAPRDTEQYRYTYSPGREMPPTRAGDVGEFQYFRPSYTRLAAGGGLMDVLPVERMSDMNLPVIQRMDDGGNVAGYANGGISHLGDYSDGGRLLRGPGDGVSDSIPASIADKRPARLADGEFVVPARIVSELGNGSTDAGARKLYAMMDRVQKNRNKTVGKGKVAVDSRSEKLLPA
jgi:hypothetical protein